MTFRTRFTVACAALLTPTLMLTAQTSLSQAARPQPTAPVSQVTQAAQTEQQVNLERVTKLIQKRVETKDNKPAGIIANFAIQPENGQILFAVVRPEANSEFGTEPKAVPFDALNFDEGETAKLNISGTRYKDAPPFDPSGWGRGGHSNSGGSNWMNVVYRHYGLSAPTDDASPELVGEKAALQRASDIRQMVVSNTQKLELGKMDDLAVDLRNGRVMYAIMNVAAAQRERFVAVPWPAIDFSPDLRTLIVDVDQPTFNQAPAFTNMRDIGSAEYIKRTFAHYGVQADTVLGYVPPDGADPAAGDMPLNETQSLGGWENGGPYDRLFDPNKVETLQGQIVGYERFTPSMPGMMQGVQLRLEASNNQTAVVHLGPSWFIQRQMMPFVTGDRITMTGSRVNIAPGNEAIMAAEIRIGDQVVHLRDRNGAPRWDATYSTRGRANTPRP